MEFDPFDNCRNPPPEYRDPFGKYNPLKSEATPMLPPETVNVLEGVDVQIQTLLPLTYNVLDHGYLGL
jgi:hypothetical protein